MRVSKGVSKPPAFRFGNFYDEHLRKRLPVVVSVIAAGLLAAVSVGLLQKVVRA